MMKYDHQVLLSREHPFTQFPNHTRLFERVIFKIFNSSAFCRNDSKIHTKISKLTEDTQVPGILR